MPYKACMGSDSLVNHRQTAGVEHLRTVETPARGHAPSRAGQQDEIVLVRGEDAGSLLQDPDFRLAWVDLSDACPWATAWQSHGYAEAWLSVYEGAYEPLLIAHMPLPAP